jgi:Multidrug resistance efflux pump
MALAARRASRLIPALTLLLAACDDERPTQPPAAPSVTIAAARMRAVTDSAEFVGQVAAAQSADIVARVEGFLEGVEVEDGAFVREGELLFRIERARYEANLAAAEAEVASAEAALALADLELERSAELLRRETIAQAQFDVAERSARRAPPRSASRSPPSRKPSSISATPASPRPSTDASARSPSAAATSSARAHGRSRR